MATQNCPKCRSKRVRLGYRPTSIFLKLIFRYNLLCDECNWEFTGFGVPGTVPKKTKKKRVNDSQKNFNHTNIGFIENEQELINESLVNSNSIETVSKTENEDNNQLKKTRFKKKVKVKLF